MKEENKHFFADFEDLDKEKYCVFKYYFETPFDVEDTAAHLCREQSTALWKRVDIDEDFRPVHGAKVIQLERIGSLKSPSIEAPHAKGESYNQVIVRIAHPHINFGPKLPNLITVACGEGAFFLIIRTSLRNWHLKRVHMGIMRRMLMTERMRIRTFSPCCSIQLRQYRYRMGR